MGRLNNSLYLEDLDSLLLAPCIDWSVLDGCVIAIAGATGTVGTVLTDALMRGREQGMNWKVIAMGRNAARAADRLPYGSCSGYRFYETDISVPGAASELEADLIVHLASTTHPRAYATQPIETITSNIIGLVNLAERARVRKGKSSLVFTSSVEIYGENRGDVDTFDEKYCGYINCNTLRAGYPESKRVGEALCEAYIAERSIGIAIPRLPRVYGPTMLESDSKAISQFVRSAVAGQNIVLKSSGTQLYSYGYVTDVVMGLLACATRGVSGVAYNVCGKGSDITLLDAATYLAQLGGVEVQFKHPDDVEKSGYSTATKATLDGSRIAKLGYAPVYDVRSGLERTFTILRTL